MNLLKDGLFSIRWLLAVVRAFVRARPATTVAVGILSVLAQLVGLVATFLPLKVIILVGSDGVPRYFRAFMGADSGDRMDWIVALSIAAVASFVLTLILESIVERLSEKASMDVLSGANEMAVASRMRIEAQTYYSRFMGVATSFAFGFVGIGTLAFLHPTLFLVIVAVVLIELLLTALALAHGDPHRPGALRRLISDKLSGYLEGLATIAFLVGFLTLLAAYLLDIETNILIAILAVIIMRRCFSSIAQAVRNLALLTKRRPVINPLVFRQQTVMTKEPDTNRSLRELFRKASRERRVTEELRHALNKDYRAAVRRVDSQVGGVSLFDVEASEPGKGNKRFFQLQVFSPKSLHLLENEEFLFSFLSRKALDAPGVVARFSEGPFECQLVESGEGMTLPSEVWPDAQLRTLMNHWGARPPEKLLSAFRTGKSFLADRLRRDFIGRISVAIDAPEERDLYKRLLAALPAITAVIDRVPIYVFNPDFQRGKTARNEDGSGLVMFWGRWLLAPIGARPLDKLTDEQIASMIREVAKRRPDVPADLAPAHLRFVGMCYDLERSINKEEYKAGLAIASRILASPALGS